MLAFGNDVTIFVLHRRQLGSGIHNVYYNLDYNEHEQKIRTKGVVHPTLVDGHTRHCTGRRHQEDQYDGDIPARFLAPQITAASRARASRSSSWGRRRRGWSGGGHSLQLRPASRATEKGKQYLNTFTMLISKGDKHYIDIEISRSEGVAVRGREVTRVVGDVDVSVIADLEGAKPK